jgi:hypothetical protein
MNNGWPKLAIQEKFRITHWFSSLLGQTKIWDRLGLGLGMALHRLIQLLFSKCWKHEATKSFIGFHKINVLHKIFWSFLSYLVVVLIFFFLLTLG